MRNAKLTRVQDVFCANLMHQRMHKLTYQYLNRVILTRMQYVFFCVYICAPARVQTRTKDNRGRTQSTMLKAPTRTDCNCN